MKNWIQKAIKHPGALHEDLGIAPGEKIPKAKLKEAAKSKGVEGKRARLAETLEGLKHGSKKKEREGGKKGDKKLHDMAVKAKNKKAGNKNKK